MRELVIGASGSGKSEYAEKMLVLKQNLFYVATMKPYGKQGEMRVQKHRRQREGKGFITIERYTDIANIVVPPDANLLLECMGNLVANELFEIGAGAESRILGGIAELSNKCENLVIVTNDVFCDGVKYSEETMEYIRCLGYVNREIARKFGGVTEVACGIGVKYHAPDK